MKDKTQYNQPGTGNVRATLPAQVTTRTSTDIKISQLEDQIALQQKEISKLRRDVIRLKSDISDVITILRNRG